MLRLPVDHPCPYSLSLYSPLVHVMPRLLACVQHKSAIDLNELSVERNAKADENFQLIFKFSKAEVNNQIILKQLPEKWKHRQRIAVHS